MLAVIQALFASLIGGAIWMKAVVSRFSASRGLALATVLSGAGIAASLWPIIAAYFIAFDREVFASVYSIMVSILAVSSTLGPLVVGAIYDHRGAYDLYFIGIIPMAVLAAALVGAVSPGELRWRQPEPEIV